MAYIEAVILGKWVNDAQSRNVPNAISDIYAWAMANGEQLPDGVYGRYEDVCGQANVHQKILDDLAVFVAKVEMTVNTAQHFANDPRFWVLGYKRFDDEGEVTFSNWGEPLTVQERQAAAQYVTNNSKITAQQLADAFDVTDTRREVAQKLKAFFRG